MKMYLVVNYWSNESAVDMEDKKLFSTYEKAKEYFEKIKNEIKSFNLGYDEIEDEENLYCESVNGEYLYYHELVKIEEMEVQ